MILKSSKLPGRLRWPCSICINETFSTAISRAKMFSSMMIGLSSYAILVCHATSLSLILRITARLEHRIGWRQRSCEARSIQRRPMFTLSASFCGKCLLPIFHGRAAHRLTLQAWSATIKKPSRYLISATKISARSSIIA